jgi:uncharacterized repeat protein (TIGR03803 family)
MKIKTNKILPFALTTTALVLILSAVQPVQAQTWATNGPLKVARWSHTATLLTNGSVLIAGGTIYNVGGFFADTNACELFDPLTGATTLTAPMQRKRHSHLATMLANGQVLITGGGGDASSEIYDPAGGTWINYASMSHERLVHTATLLDNDKVLVAGGYDDSGGGELSSAELYDPGLGTWANVAPMPYAADTLASVLLPNGMVLVCGGYDGNNAVTNAVLYDPSSQNWSDTAPMSQARSGHTATLMWDGNVLVVGGTGDNSTEVYDYIAGVWNKVSDMNDGWLYPNTVLLSDGQVMVVGDGNTDVELYDPGSDTWNLVDSLPVAGHLQTATLLASGAVLVTGGSDSQYNGPALAAVQVYGSLVTSPNLNVTNTPQSGAPPLHVQFTSPSVDSAGNTVTNWNWNFGDGGTSTEQSPSHTYSSVGAYSPSLTAYSTFASSPLNITGLGTIFVAVPSLNANASPQTGQAPLTVQFSTPSQDSDGFTVTNWNWNFGDGGTSTAQNPSHTYVNPGIFSPSLEARSTYNSLPVILAYGFTTITVTNPPNPFFRNLYNFTAVSGSSSTNGDGVGPNGGLVLIGNNLYGTTQHGGGNGLGTLFSIRTDGSSFLNWYNFSFANGAIPPDGVILSGGTFFGATYLGGTRGGGTIFAINTNGTGNTNLLGYNFNVDPNSGQEPQSGVVLADKTLYNTTWYGGAFNHGTISYATTNGVSSGIFHNFSTPTGPNFNLNGDGLFPSSKLIFSNGTLYGTAEGGGTFGRGTVFAADTNNPGSFRALHYFTATDQSTGTNTDGGNPFAGVVPSGNTLYGTTFDGGSYGYGTVFAVNTDGSGFTNLHSFTGTHGDYGPHSGLTLSGSTLYGTTSGGGLLGTLSSGTLFAINTDGSGYQSLYSFSGSSDGAAPQGDLIVYSNTLYGTTASGGSSGNGTVFSFTLPSPLLLTDLVKLPGGPFQFGFTNIPSSINTVFATTNLTLAFSNWAALGTAVEISAGHFQFTDPQGTNNSKRFYRVRSP